MLFLLFGCLPPDALSRQTELPSQRYELQATMGVQTHNPELAAFAWQLKGLVDVGYARTYRDHSIGSLVQFSEASSRVDGVEVESGLKDLRIELRSFDRGEVLALVGADAGVGQKKHLEALDVLWPALVPKVEVAGKKLQLLTSWPVTENWRLGRTQMVANGSLLTTRHQTNLSWEGQLHQEDAIVSREGTVKVEAVVDRDEARTLSAHWVVERRVEPHWRNGPQQVQHLELTLKLLGPAPPLPIVPPAAQDSRYADALPLVLSDGTALQHPEVHIEEALPFLVFPDTWSPAELVSFLGG